ncbi:MAG: hypothetical protein V7749_00035 [Cocleimonas sp.]|jgi:hypothetical protein
MSHPNNKSTTAVNMESSERGLLISKPNMQDNPDEDLIEAERNFVCAANHETWLLVVNRKTYKFCSHCETVVVDDGHQ